MQAKKSAVPSLAFYTLVLSLLIGNFPLRLKVTLSVTDKTEISCVPNPAV